MHAGLLDYFGDEFAEEYEEVEFLIGEEEPRTLAEIVDAMEEFFDRVGYVRSIVLPMRRMRKCQRINEEVPEDIRAGARAARQRVEDRYGRTPSGNPSAPVTMRHGSTATSAGSWPPCAGCSAASGTSWTHRVPQSHDNDRSLAEEPPT